MTRIIQRGRREDRERENGKMRVVGGKLVYKFHKRNKIGLKDKNIPEWELGRVTQASLIMVTAKTYDIGGDPNT